MEKLMTIQRVFPMTERPYTDKSGNAQVFASKGFLLSDGIDTLYAEMVGDMARANRDVQYDLSVVHAVQLQCQARSYKDAQGAEHISNELRIVKLA